MIQSSNLLSRCTASDFRRSQQGYVSLRNNKRESRLPAFAASTVAAELMILSVYREIRAEIQAVESGQRDQDLLIKLRPDLRERVTVPKTAPTRSRKSRQTNQSAESVEDDEAVDDVAVEALLTGRSTAPLVSPLLETLKALPPTTPRLDVVPESDPILESEEPTKKKALRSSGRQSTRGKVDMEESDQASDLDGESVVRQSRRQDTAGEGIEEEEEDGTSKPSGSVPPRSEDATNGGEGESASSSRRTSRKNATGATSKSQWPRHFISLSPLLF